MENLGINLKLLIAQIINFALFFYIFKKFVARPFNQFLNLEIQKEKEKEELLEEIKKKEEALMMEEKKTKERIKREYEKILNDAKREADKIKEKIISEAKFEAEKIINKGRQQVQEEREAMNREIKKKVVELSLLIVERALNQFLDREMQNKINQRILKNFSKKIE